MSRRLDWAPSSAPRRLPLGPARPATQFATGALVRVPASAPAVLRNCSTPRRQGTPIASHHRGRQASQSHSKSGGLKARSLRFGLLSLRCLPVELNVCPSLHLSRRVALTALNESKSLVPKKTIHMV